MNLSIQKIFATVVGVIVVLFLLFDGGGMTAATVSGDMAVTHALSEYGWIWIVPTLLIFGLGFLLAWIVLGKEGAPPSARNVRSHEALSTRQNRSDA